MKVNKPSRLKTVTTDQENFNKLTEGKTLKATTIKIRESQLLNLQEQAYQKRISASELVRDILQEHGIT